MDSIELIRGYLIEIDSKQWLLFALFPMFLAVAAAEAWHYKGTDIYKLKDSLASVTLGGAYLCFEVLLYALFVWTIFDWVYQFRLITVNINVFTFLLLYILVDILFYFYHFTAHKVRYFWAGHIVHHASEHMNFTTAMRQSALYPLSFIWAFFLPLTFLGFEREWVFFALALNLAYQYFIHTQWVGKLPQVLELILNTPSHHRVHHGRNERYIDKNFAGTFIVWDRIFGTFVEEDPNEKSEYGITRQVHSYNPVWLTMHEWVDMFKDVAQPGPWRVKLKHIWGAPEWQRESKVSE